MDDNIDRTVDFQCHGVDYILRMVNSAEALVLELEDRVTGQHWKNTFGSNYLEEITQKTGNAKKFPVFCKMLLTAITRANDSVVFLDILTSQDLELMKARKTQGAGGPVRGNTPQSGSANNNKRYLILTYVVEYDKVHYPLPLHFEEPDVETMKITIRRLRMENEDLKARRSTGDRSGGTFLTGTDLPGSNSNNNAASEAMISSLRGENEALKQKLKRLEDSAQQRHGAVELDALLKRKTELEREMEEMRGAHEREVGRLNSRIEMLEREVEEKNTDLLGENNEMNNSRKTISRQQREMDGLVKELEALRNNDKKQKGRLKQLEMELESSLRRPGSRPTDRRSPYVNRTGGFSPASSTGKGGRVSSIPSRSSSPGGEKRPSYGNRSNASSASKGRNVSSSPSQQLVKKVTTPTKITTKTYGGPSNRSGGGTYGGFNKQASPKMSAPVRKTPSPGRGSNPMNIVGKNFAGNTGSTYGTNNKRPGAGGNTGNVGRGGQPPSSNNRTALNANNNANNSRLGTGDSSGKKVPAREFLGGPSVNNYTTAPNAKTAPADTLEIVDIDARLNKLTELLKMSKS